MLRSRPTDLQKSIVLAFALGLFSTISTALPGMDTSLISRWVHTGFFMHDEFYENDRAVLKLLEDQSFDLKYVSYFENNDDTTWEKKMEASGSYEIRGTEIIFTIKVLVGTEDRDKPHYNCPFTLNKKALILKNCALFDIKNTYEFKRTDPDAFYFE